MATWSISKSNADARLSAGSTLLLAQALDTTPAALAGRVERSAGRGRAGPHPQLQPLTPEQIEAHLSAGGVGRIVFSTERGPVALLVNYEYSKGNVVISTDIAKADARRSTESSSFGWRRWTWRVGQAVPATPSLPSARRRSQDG